jgi:hypothetical protein
MVQPGIRLLKVEQASPSSGVALHTQYGVIRCDMHYIEAEAMLHAFYWYN